MNGRVYQDGETFQPHCRIRCHCEDGGFTCVPLCSEDVRLPSWDCPHPRRVEVPGRCCPEWVCDRGGELGTQPLPAQGECGPAQARGGATWGRGGATWGRSHLGRGRGFVRHTWTCQSAGFPDSSWEGLVAEETGKAQWGVTRPLSN